MVLGQLEAKEYVFNDGFTPKPRGAGTYKPIKYVINTKGCWECVSHAGSKHRGSYPVIERGGKQLRMSRYVYEIVYGYLSEDKYVMHSCDNPKCINPNHLSLGTPWENTQDMIAKGRKPVGEKVPAAKLREEDVIRIFSDTRSCIVVAEEYGVSKKSVLNIRHGRTWKYLNLKGGRINER